MPNVFLTKLLKAFGPDRVQASGSFTTAGTGAVSTSNLYGIASIARTGVGVFLVTLQDGGKEYLPIVSIEGTAALTANTPVVTAKSLTAKTITITVAAAGAAADTTGLTINVAVQIRRGN